VVPDHRSPDHSNGLLLSVSRFHTGNRSRNYLSPIPSPDHFRAVSKKSGGAWRWIYVVGAVICLYFNLFVLVVQSFEKIPALHALAPTQTESPFKLTQLVVLTISALLCIVALIRFRPEPANVA